LQLVYVDTSVPNAYFDTRWPERMRVTRTWWRRVRPNLRLAVSDAVVEEIVRAPARRRKAMLRLVADFEILDVSASAKDLAAGYIAAGILPRSSFNDAVHIAVATVHRADYLLTWNIRHMASAARRARVRGYNESKGLSSPELVTPEELRGNQEPA